MSAASTSDARKRRAPEVDPLALIHEFESATLGLHDPVTEGSSSLAQIARRDRAVDALMVAMGEPPIYGANR